MNAITVNSFDGRLFREFIAYIDRGEKTTRSYINNLKQFAAWLKYEGIENPTRQDIISYRDYLTAEHAAICFDAEKGWSYREKNGAPVIIQCKPNTVRQYLRIVCQFFRWTETTGLYPNVAANIHTPKVNNETHKRDALAAHEVLKIEQSIITHAAQKIQQANESTKDTAGRVQRSEEQGKRLKAMYLLAVTAGLRTIELNRLNVCDFAHRRAAEADNYCVYIQGKGHTEADQRKPIAPEVAEAIIDYLQTRPDAKGSDPLFASTGNRSKGKRIASTTISTMLKQAMIEAGYNSKRLTAHSLRHTAGTAAQELTGDIYTTQKYLRHSNPATTEIYLHNDTEAAEADLAAGLYNYYHGKQADKREQLTQLLSRMNAQQLEQLATIATALQ